MHIISPSSSTIGSVSQKLFKKAMCNGLLKNKCWNQTTILSSSLENTALVVWPVRITKTSKKTLLFHKVLATKQQQQQQLPVRSRLHGVWGEPNVSSLTLTSIDITKRPSPIDPQKSNKKLRKPFYSWKLLLCKSQINNIKPT